MNVVDRFIEMGFTDSESRFINGGQKLFNDYFPRSKVLDVRKDDSRSLLRFVRNYEFNDEQKPAYDAWVAFQDAPALEHLSIDQIDNITYDEAMSVVINALFDYEQVFFLKEYDRIHNLVCIQMSITERCYYIPSWNALDNFIEAVRDYPYYKEHCFSQTYLTELGEGYFS